MVSNLLSARPTVHVRTLLLAVLVAGVLAPIGALAQPIDWTQRPGSGGPSPRVGHAMAYDAARGVTVLFGGNDIPGNTDYNAETWEWNGTVWTRRVVSGPSPRALHAMAYDAARGVTVLFGGFNNNNGYSGETWEWNGTTWTQRLVSGPSARWLHVMAYDAARGVTVLFGGQDNNGQSAETWEWNGTGGGAWTQRVVSGPSARYHHAMAYDAARGVSVLFGGYTTGPNAETWEWNGTGGGAWTQRLASGPSRRYIHAMAYDAARGVTVLFGGEAITGINAETWEWNGTGGGTWTQRVVSGPSARFHQAMAYDAARGVTVLFGGVTNSGYSGETWVLQGVCTTVTSITAQPVGQTVCTNGSAIFAISAGGSAPLGYEWQVQTAPSIWQRLGNTPGPLPCGGSASAYATPVNSPSVTIGMHSCPGNPIAPQHFQVRCIVSNPCGSTASDEAIYTICPADFNCSGSLNINDIFAFLAAWFAGDPSADFNGANGINVADIFAFLDAWFTGCS